MEDLCQRELTRGATTRDRSSAFAQFALSRMQVSANGWKDTFTRAGTGDRHL